MVKIRLLVVISLVCFFAGQRVFADQLILKSGKIVRGKIVENSKDYVKIDFDGQLLTYFTDEVEKIEQEDVAAAQGAILSQEEDPSSAKNAATSSRTQAYQALVKGDYAGAMSYMQKVLEVEGETPDKHIFFGSCQYYLGNFNEAVVELEKGKNSKAALRRAVAYIYLGLANKSLGKTEDARTAFSEAIKIFDSIRRYDNLFVLDLLKEVAK